MLPYQAISLLKKPNKSAAKVFQSQCTVSTKPPGCAGVWSACSEAAASPFCVISVGRGLGGTLWCMTADLSAGGWKGDPKAFSGVVGELLQEPVQPRSRNMQGRRLVLPVICSV